MISTVHTGGPLEMALTIALSLFDDIVVETKKQFWKKIIKGICLCVDEWFQEQVLAIAKPHTVIIEPSISLLGVSTSEKQQIKPNTKQFIALRDSYRLQTVFICLSTLDYLQFAFQFLCVILRCFFFVSFVGRLKRNRTRVTTRYDFEMSHHDIFFLKYSRKKKEEEKARRVDGKKVQVSRDKYKFFSNTK